MKLFVLFTLLATGLLAAGPAAAQTPRTAPRITQLMSTADLDATGVGSLTPNQLDALSAWLANYRSAAEWLAVTAAQGEDMVSTGDEVVETAIEGDFDGWVGDTIFRLKNGQVWQQASPSAHYLFAHGPKVTISRAPYRMRVDGLAVEIAVRRLR